MTNSKATVCINGKCREQVTKCNDNGNCKKSTYKNINPRQMNHVNIGVGGLDPLDDMDEMYFFLQPKPRPRFDPFEKLRNFNPLQRISNWFDGLFHRKTERKDPHPYRHVESLMQRV